MMNASQVYIALSLVVLAIIAILVIFTSKKKQKQPSKLAMFAFLLVISSIVFGDNRLIGAGVLLSVIDIITNRKNK